jgi:hypothetical protein
MTRLLLAFLATVSCGSAGALIHGFGLRLD